MMAIWITDETLNVLLATLNLFFFSSCGTGWIKTQKLSVESFSDYSLRHICMADTAFTNAIREGFLNQLPCDVI